MDDAIALVHDRALFVHLVARTVPRHDPTAFDEGLHDGLLGFSGRDTAHARRRAAKVIPRLRAGGKAGQNRCGRSALFLRDSENLVHRREALAGLRPAVLAECDHASRRRVAPELTGGRLLHDQAPALLVDVKHLVDADAPPVARAAAGCTPHPAVELSVARLARRRWRGDRRDRARGAPRALSRCAG